MSDLVAKAGSPLAQQLDGAPGAFTANGVSYGAAYTPGIVIKVDGQVFDVWTRCEVTRDLGDISGSFLFDYDDRERFAKLLPAFNAPGLAEALEPGPVVRIEIDGELVLLGHLVDVNIEAGPEELRASVFGLDFTGDLVECSANPEGPMEYLGLDLLGIVQRLIAPFGMTARAECDVGDPFPHFSIDVSETVMSAVEKAARQRGILVLSDGVGGLVLTESGKTRAPAPLLAGVNIHRTRVHLSWRGRYSDHYIKGQLPHVRSVRTKRAAALDGTAMPLDTAAPLPPPPADTAGTPRRHGKGSGHHGAVYQSGHATDAGVTRYRPRVWITRAEAGLDTVDEQAAWRARLTAAQAATNTYTVVGHRPTAVAALWRPNTLVAVTDPLAGLEGVDQLIAGVIYLDGEDGARTVLRVVDPLAYSLDEEAGGPRRAGRARARHGHAVDATSRRFR